MAYGWDGNSHIVGRKKLKFLGTRYLKILHNASLNITGSFSIGFQIQPLPTSSLTYIILSKGHPENLLGTGSFSFESINGFLRVSLSTGSTRVYADTNIPILNSNKIRSVFVVWNSLDKTISIYLDAVQIPVTITGDLNDITNININTSDLEIGKATGKNPLYGTLTDFVIADRVLSEIEIFNYYESIKYTGSYPVLGKIVFSKFDTSLGRFQLNICNEDGSDPEILLNTSTSDFYPRWSPDGTRVLYNTDDFGIYPIRSNEYYSIDSTGGDSLYIGGGPYSACGGWMPDGNIFAQSWGGTSGGGSFPKIMSPIGGVIKYYDQNHNAFFNGQALFAEYSPVGNFFIYIDYAYTMYKINLDINKDYLSNQPLDFVATSAGTFAFNLGYPRISPDGSKLVYSKRVDHSQPYNLFTMDVDGSNIEQITGDTVDSYLGSYSPDGSKIVFSKNVAGVYQLHTCNFDGTNIIQITNGSENCLSSSWKI